MSKKVKSKSKPVSKSKPKKSPASKKVSKKKAKPVVKKAAAKKVVKVKKVIKKATKKSAPKAKQKKAPKALSKKIVKPVAKVPAKSTADKKSTIVKNSRVEEKKNLKHPQKPSAPVKPAEKTPEALPKNIHQQNRPSVGRPIPVNRRPEPARALINSNKPKEESGKNRYSDAELEEFREIINDKLKNARKELATLQAQMTAANDHGTDDTASTFKILEDGSDSLAKEEAGQLASRQKKFIEQLENALVRIENKTYGICRVTGKLIPKERLRAVPHTTQSIEAKLNQYRD